MDTSSNSVITVGEIGINHNGDIDTAKKLIDVAVEGKCNYVKFQKRDIEIAIPKHLWYTKRETPWGIIDYIDYKKRLELSYKDYQEIDKYCKEKGIGWFASAWDISSVEFLRSFTVPFMKIPSALITNKKLLYKIKETNIPTIISCGMSNKKEVDNCLNILGRQVKYILSCTSSYPTPEEDMNMNRINTLKKIYGDKYKIGFSNHFKSFLFILQAYIMKCEMLEFHITLDWSMFGTDQSASISPTGVYKLMKYITAYEKGWGDGKIECLPSEISVKEKLRNEQ